MSTVVGSGPPTTPEGVSVYAAGGQALVQWEANGESDLAGYNVYRGASAGGPFTKTNTALAPVPLFIDGGLSSGTEYVYRVTAVDRTGRESDPSSLVTTTVTTATVTVAPQPPISLTVAPGDGALSLTWYMTPTAAIAFRVYAGDNPVGPFTEISGLSPVMASNLTERGLVNQKARWYRVSSIDFGFHESQLSPPAAGTPVDQAPSAPVGASASLLGTQVLIEWNRSSEWDLAGYYVYRAVDGGDSHLTSSPVTTTSYADTVAYGRSYSYAVTAVDGAGKESARSSQLLVRAGAAPETLLQPRSALTMTRRLHLPLVGSSFTPAP